MPLYRITYKSGAVVDVWATNLTVVKNDGNLSQISMSGDAKPFPLLVGVNDIASVWRMD